MSENNSNGGMTWMSGGGSSYSSPWSSPGQPSTGTKPYIPPYSPIGGNSNPYYLGGQPQQTTNNFFGGYHPLQNTPNPIGKTTPLPRNKYVVICDFYDNVVETYVGTPGNNPRGMYDVRPKFALWDKIRFINPSFVVVCTNQPFEMNTDMAKAFGDMASHYMRALAEYIQVPVGNVVMMCKYGYDKSSYMVKPNPGLGIEGLKRVGELRGGKAYDLSEVLCIGQNSGNVGQSDIDKRFAQALGVDYIDINELINLYV